MKPTIAFMILKYTSGSFFKISNTRDMNEQFTKKVLESVLNDDNLLFGWCFAAGLIVD